MKKAAGRQAGGLFLLVRPADNCSGDHFTPDLRHLGGSFLLAGLNKTNLSTGSLFTFGFPIFVHFYLVMAAKC